MGEYAVDKRMRQKVKIGTCSFMHYLTYGERDFMLKDRYSLDPKNTKGLAWRLPFPDDPLNLNERRMKGYPLVGFELEEELEPGIIQLSHESGLTVNVNCYHGVKLPEGTAEFRAFWNGKASCFFELAYLYDTKTEAGEETLKPLLRCKHCGKFFEAEWEEIVSYIDNSMLERIENELPGKLHLQEMKNRLTAEV